MHLPLDLVQRISGGQFAGPVESDDASIRVEDDDQRSDSVEDGGDYVALLLQRFPRVLQIGDIKSNAVDEPGFAVRAAHHLGVAVEPDHPSIARDHTIGRSQRLAGKKHAGCLKAPALFVVGMNVLVPADRDLPATPPANIPARPRSAG